MKELTNEDVPEVDEFVRIKLELDIFKRRHASVFEQLAMHVERYSAALEAADKAVRSRGVSVGDFKILRETHRIDAERLFDLVGREEFLRLGGSITQKTVFEVDKNVFRAAIATKQLSPEVASVYTVSFQYTKPKEIKL